MKPIDLLLTGFFEAIENDPRIGVSHISLYCAFLKNCSELIDDNYLSIVKTDVMRLAKISGRATYHRCITDLHDFGYIKYVPSYNHRKKSKVYLLS